MSKNLISVLRQVAPYIEAYDKKRFVVVLPHFKQKLPWHFNSIIEDVILLKKLGMELILVMNTPEPMPLLTQISETDLSEKLLWEKAAKSILEQGFSLKNSPITFFAIRARKFGVYSGTDTEFLGQFEKINLEDLNFAESESKLLAISPIAKNKAGEELFIHPLNLATELAQYLKAEKLIIYTEQLMRVPISYKLRDIEVSCDFLFEKHGLPSYFQSFFDYHDLSTIKRTHFIDSSKHSLIEEIFSVEGSGILLNTDVYDEVRPATAQDSHFIQKLIEKNIKQQAMVFRDEIGIQSHIDEFSVFDREGFIVGCGALTLLEPDLAEIYAFTIHKDYQKQGRAAVLLSHLEAKARNLNVKKILIKTTRGEQWFVDKGYELRSVEDLPVSLQESYNQERKSKILIKTL